MITGFDPGRRVWFYLDRAPMPKFFIKTYGCQMNERDSEQVARSLLDRGYELAPVNPRARARLMGGSCWAGGGIVFTFDSRACLKAIGKMASPPKKNFQALLSHHLRKEGSFCFSHSDDTCR